MYFIFYHKEHKEHKARNFTKRKTEIKEKEKLISFSSISVFLFVKFLALCSLVTP